MNLRHLAPLLFFAGLLFHEKGHVISVTNHFVNPILTEETEPWFTGPLLAPSASTIPPGHFNIEPYTYFTASQGTYSSSKHFVSRPTFYSLIEQVPIQIGINSFMDCQIIPQLFYQFTQGERSVQPGDIPLTLGFQLLQNTPGTYFPSVKLCFNGSIPCGKYEDLSQSKLRTDGVGSGSWRPSLGLNMSYLYQLSENHFLSPRLSINYLWLCNIPVQGISVYGGAPDTKGKILGGGIFLCDLGLECNITRSWALAMDVFYQHLDKIGFSGDLGSASTIGSPASEQLSLAPALEYNWNINVGLIAGVWFTVMGKNANQFTSAVIALNIYK